MLVGPPRADKLVGLGPTHGNLRLVASLLEQHLQVVAPPRLIVDREYPLHRYYLQAKELELALGGATAQLLRIGEILAEAP